MIRETNRHRLIESYACLANQLVKRYGHWSLDQADLEQAAMAAVITAVDQYEPKLGVPLGAYVTLCVKWELSDLVKAAARQDRLEGRLPCDVTDRVSELEDGDDFSELWDAIDKLPNRERTMLKCSYGLDGWPALKKTDVAKRFKTSRVTVADCNGRSLRELRALLSA